jgi:uncharacterized membrane protein
VKFFPLLLLNVSPGRDQPAFRVLVQEERSDVASNRFGRLAIALLLIGAALRIGQYSISGSLWLDELAIARNVVDKPIRELLTGPLDHTQVAPPGFLVIEKAAIMVLGNNEYALRLFPQLCALAALPLFAAVAWRVLSPLAALLAIGLFSLSPAVIAFGSEVKQYSTDIVAALLIVVLSLRYREQRGADRNLLRGTLLGAAGFITVWFSHPAVLALAGIGLVLLIEAAQQRDQTILRSLVPIAILWGLAALGSVFWGLKSMSPSTHGYMQTYWAEAFMPLPPRSIDDALWLWRALRRFFQGEFHYPFPKLSLLLMVLGGLSLARRHLWSALVLLAPVGVSLLASAAHQYPFGGRVSLFLLPGILLLVVEGVDQVRHAAAARWQPLGATVVLLATTTAAYALYQHYPVYPNQPMRQVLQYVQARRQPGDPVYVYIGARHAVGYYGAHYGLPPQAVTIGGCPRDQRGLLRDLDQFRGQPRLWVIVSHAIGPIPERETMLGYLDAIGVQRDTILIPVSRSSAYLYDLSDPGRLRGASAATHVLPPRLEGVREYSCTPDSPKTR